MGARLRKIGKDETLLVAKLDRAEFKEDAFSTSEWEELLLDPSQQNYFLEVDGRIVGVGGVFLKGTTANITTIMVIPNERGKGLGKVLLKKLVGVGKRRGAKKFLLQVRPENYRAKELYGAFGFTKKRMVTDYYSDRSPAEVMEL